VFGHRLNISPHRVNNSSLDLYGNVIKKFSNVDNVMDELKYDSCNNSVLNNSDLNNLKCSYINDANTYLIPTNNIADSSSISININKTNTLENTINLELNMFDINGLTINDKLTLIYGNINNDLNYNYVENITRNNKLYKVNMVGFDSYKSESGKKNKLDFNVEIISF
jgi:hypothetical protein